MILSSTTRESVNGAGPFYSGQVRPEDPMPWVCSQHGERYSDENVRERNPVARCDTYDPRPEYRAPANPILVTFREYVSEWIISGTTVAALAEDFMSASPTWRDAARQALPEHIVHARKVLTRLSQLPTMERCRDTE